MRVTLGYVTSFAFCFTPYRNDAQGVDAPRPSQLHSRAWPWGWQRHRPRTCSGEI